MIQSDTPIRSKRHVGLSTCRLCGNSSKRHQAKLPTTYWHCLNCDLICTDPRCLPSTQAEFDHYCQHENDPENLGYRAFLSRLGTPLAGKLSGHSSGLDYGCGPGPGLAVMFEEFGHEVALFDPFFAPDPSVLERQYDFILCSEVAEHFHWPRQEFDRLANLLKPKGWMGIMTCFREAGRSFEGWHYRKDPTHVAFYSRQTFDWIARFYDYHIEVPRKDVVLLQKSDRSRSGL